MPSDCKTPRLMTGEMETPMASMVCPVRKENKPNQSMAKVLERKGAGQLPSAYGPQRWCTCIQAPSMGLIRTLIPFLSPKSLADEVYSA
jgi:hypothetical protein